MWKFGATEAHILFLRKVCIISPHENVLHQLCGTAGTAPEIEESHGTYDDSTTANGIEFIVKSLNSYLELQQKVGLTETAHFLALEADQRNDSLKILMSQVAQDWHQMILAPVTFVLSYMAASWIQTYFSTVIWEIKLQNMIYCNSSGPVSLS